MQSIRQTKEVQPQQSSKKVMVVSNKMPATDKKMLANYTATKSNRT